MYSTKYIKLFVVLSIQSITTYWLLHWMGIFRL